MMRTLSRRVFVTLLAAVAVRRAQSVGVAATTQGTEAGLDRFLALSSRLTGHTPLDPIAGRLYLAALVASPARRGLLISGSPFPPSRHAAGVFSIHAHLQRGHRT